MKNCSNPLQLQQLAAALTDGLKAELFLTPKPGLVDLRNQGSHSDLSLPLMARSLVLMRGYLDRLCRSLSAPSGGLDPVVIGRQAEEQMLATLGTNCHRGGIFLCGLLLTAASRCDLRNTKALQSSLKMTAAGFFASRRLPSTSNGEAVRKANPQSGIIAEALAGLPSVFENVLPHVMGHSSQRERGIFMAMAELMLCVDDSTCRHRCGDAGIAQLRDAGQRLKQCLVAGRDPVPLLYDLDDEFQQTRLTMGGVADLLGLGLGYAAYLQHS